MARHHERRRLEKIFDALYDTRGTIYDPCTYCGLPADGWDHVPPLTIVARMDEHQRRYADLRKYPCCNECNSALGGIRLFALRERKRHIAQYLRKKYRKILTIPAWSDDEIAELGPSLTTSINAYGNFAACVRERLYRATS